MAVASLVASIAAAPFVGTSLGREPNAVPAAMERAASLASHHYTMYGKTVFSDLGLPLRPVTSPPAGADSPDWTFRRAGAMQDAPAAEGHVTGEIYCHAPCHQGGVVLRVTRGPAGTWVWLEAL